MKKILKDDNTKCNNLKEFVGIVSDEEEIDPLEEKKNVKIVILQLQILKQFNVTDIVSYNLDFDKIKGIRRIYL